ncbi:MAG: hypothetical protein HY670_00505 [Chloroflexi bacterium]|nr:hypothetical protein [Chloroflexota bacterium]
MNRFLAGCLALLIPMVLSTPIHQDVSAASSTDGMVAYWTFDEEAGDTVIDSANGNNGTVYGASRVQGIVGNALSFDGFGDYILVPNSESLAFAGQGTLEFWMKASGAVGTLFWKRFYAGSHGWTLYFGFPEKLIAYLNDNATYFMAELPYSADLRHIGLVYEPTGVLKLYVNGVVTQTLAYAPGFEPTTANLYVGRDEMGNYFTGLLDEVAIYNRALSQAELQSHYEKGLQGTGYAVSLTVGVNGNGSVTPAAGTHAYEMGTVLNITATPAQGWEFVNWSGDVETVADTSSNNTTITMDGNYAISANFSQTVPKVQVTVNAPARVPPEYDFTVSVDIGSVQDLDASNYNVTFDKAVLRLDNVTSGNINGTAIPMVQWNENPAGSGTYTIVQNITGLTGVSGSGYLSVLHFRSVGSIGDSSNITLSNGNLSDIFSDEILAEWVGDSILVSNTPGDANGDGVVDALDITKVERIIAGLDALTYGADANLVS